MFNLPHIDLWLTAYGVLMFLGIWSLWRKLRSGQLVRLVAEVGVFWLVFRLNGGTLGGGFIAMFFALCAGIAVAVARKHVAKIKFL
jgi:hypothetical protein